MLGQFFDESCLPGSRNPFYEPLAHNPDSLCSLCQTQLQESSTTAAPRPMAILIDGEDKEDDNDGIEAQDETLSFVPNRAIDCIAASSNRFYGTKGALACLSEVGEVAVLEHQNLVQHALNLTLNPEDFRIICRNGSLAANPGFDVDSACFLTTIVDGEIVVRRNSTKTQTVVNTLLSLDKYLQNDPDFKMYNIFQGERNLLFEDSSVGLISPNASDLSVFVQNYIKLFADVENCIEETGGAQAVATNILLTFSLILFTALIRH